jgi:RNA polymerase sigma factor (sigma-70 family)
MTLIEAAPSVGVGDVEQLYDAFSGRLERIVRLDVRAPEVVIEDACQVAWCRLLDHRLRVHRESAMAWLARTAVNEALRLLRRDRRELSLDAALEDGEQPGLAIAPATPDELLEHRERIREMCRLPERQQRVLWLHAVGHTYLEIAAHEGCTLRTVDRQLTRAKAALRDAAHRDGALPDCAAGGE